MSGAPRWWRPDPRRNVRPGARAAASRARWARYTGDQVDEVFGLGYDIGMRDERKRHQERDEQITRLASAADAAANGDPSLMDEICREHDGDDLLDLADAAGATPLAEVDGDKLAAEVEQWLRRGVDGDGPPVI